MVNIFSSSIAVIVLAALMTTGQQFANAAPDNLLDSVLAAVSDASVPAAVADSSSAKGAKTEPLLVAMQPPTVSYGNKNMLSLGLPNPTNSLTPEPFVMPTLMPIPATKLPCKKNKDNILSLNSSNPALDTPAITSELPNFLPGDNGTKTPEITKDSFNLPTADNSSPKRRNCDKNRLSKANTDSPSNGSIGYGKDDKTIIPAQANLSVQPSANPLAALGGLFDTSMASGVATDSKMSVANAVAEDVKGLTDEQLNTLLSQSVVSKSSARRISGMQPAVALAGALAAMMVFL